MSPDPSSSEVEVSDTDAINSFYLIERPVTDDRYFSGLFVSEGEYHGLSKLENHKQILSDAKQGLVAFTNMHNLEKYSVGAEITFRMHRTTRWSNVLEEINFLYRTLKSAGVRTDRISISGRISPFDQEDDVDYVGYRFRGWQ